MAIQNLKCMASACEAEAYWKIQNMMSYNGHAAKETFEIKFPEIEFGINFGRK